MTNTSRQSSGTEWDQMVVHVNIHHLTAELLGTNHHVPLQTLRQNLVQEKLRILQCQKPRNVIATNFTPVMCKAFACPHLIK